MLFASVALVVFLAAFVQSLAGFGLAIVMVPLLTQLLGLKVAVPMVSVIGLPSGITLVLRYRHALNFQAIWRLAVASFLGVVIGVRTLVYVDEQLARWVLGAILIGYALYSMLKFHLPSLAQPVWAYVFGFASGLLGGAYSIAGPPVIIYGNCRRWLPAEFKSNLQSFFLSMGFVTITTHALSGNLTATVWQNIPAALLGMVIGMWAGVRFDNRLSPEAFRKVVLVLLVVLGVRLVF